ncbi:MAG: LysR family transcriptional regulator [Rhizobacter sp.]|nr:LysR family transcriptional regulator [Rhizobacter sp.]
MELRQLKYFVAIVESASISKAAAKVHVAQSALSLQISHLEEELGAKLLHRSGSGVTTTERGETFLRHARTVLQQLKDAQLAVRTGLDGLDGPAGEVTLAIPQSVSNALALPLIKACRARLPRVWLRITEELSGHLAEQLRRSQTMLAIQFDDGELAEFEVQPLVRERLAVVAVPGLFTPVDGQLALQQVLALPLILPGDGHGVRPLVDGLIRVAGFPFIQVVAEITSINILKSMLLAGIGATIQARAPLHDELKAGSLIAADIIEPDVFRNMALCSSRTAAMSEATQAVSRVVFDTVRNLCSKAQWQGAIPLFAMTPDGHKKD